MPKRVRKICEAAMRRLGELNPREPIGNEEARDVCDTLNSMMSGWGAKGLTYAHTPLGLNDYFPLDDKHEHGVVALLAIEISDEFAPEAVTPDLRRVARAGWAGLCGEFMIVPKSKSGLPRPSAGRRW